MSTRTTSTTKTSARNSPRKDSALGYHNRLIETQGVDDATGFSDHGREARYEVIKRCLNQFSDPALKVLDYGCNTGGLLDYLGNTLGAYWGVDINPAFIRRAKGKLWGDMPYKPKFTCGNVLVDSDYDRINRFKPDVIVASGILCYTGEAHRYPELVSRLFALSRQAFIFNALVNTRPKDRSIYVWNKGRVLRLVEACECRSWEVIQSYLWNDVTVVMRKKLTHANSE